MQIKKLVIENFKSIEKIELDNPNPFTVFVGPNGSGKSNIFEALELLNLSKSSPYSFRLFGGESKLRRKQNPNSIIQMFVGFATFDITFDERQIDPMHSGVRLINHKVSRINTTQKPDYQQFTNNYTRLFLNNDRLVKKVFKSDDRLSLDASNLEAVLKRLLSDTELREEIFEWLDLFIPGFKAVEVDDRNELHWFEDSIPEYFTKDLISDGTYNILALLTAVYQSEEPQFLCIEEVENGLHPEVILSLMNFFRKQCEEKGHYIWLNTHSETVVRQLTTDEIVLVNKRQGATQTKQVKGMNIYSLPTDEAWLTGALGGGLAW